MTLLFAGHDTTTSTVAFLFYELARNPEQQAPLLAEQDTVLNGGLPSAAQLVAEMPRLEMAVDETLRMYPPAWIGPRRSIEPFELHGVRAGRRARQLLLVGEPPPVQVFPQPWQFRPSASRPRSARSCPRAPTCRSAAARGTCIGMRFGQLEIKAIATAVLRRFSVELVEPMRPLSIRQMPTLLPARGGLPVIVRERGA